MKTHFTQPATPGNNAYFNFYRLKRQSARAITTGLLTVAATCCAFAQTPKFIVSAGSYAPATATTSIQNIGPGYGGWYSLPPAVSTPQLTLAFSGLGSVISNDTVGFDSDNTLVTACGLPGSSGANKIVFPGNIAEGTEANPTNSFKISFTNLRFTSSSNPQLTFNFNQLTGNANPVLKIKFIVAGREYVLSNDLNAALPNSWQAATFNLANITNTTFNTNLVTDINTTGAAELIFYRMGNTTGANENHFFAIDDIAITTAQCVSGFDKVWIGGGAPGSTIADRNYNRDSNWCPNGVPAASDKVLINASLTSATPISITGSFSVLSLTVINPGTGVLALRLAATATFSIGANGLHIPATSTGTVSFTKGGTDPAYIKLAGNFTKDNAAPGLTFGQGVRMELNGVNQQIINSNSDITLGDLTINNTAAGDPDVILSTGNVMVNGLLEMLEGIMTTGDNNLIEIGQQGYLFENADNYIRGNVKVVRQIAATLSPVTDFANLGSPTELGGIGVFMLLPENTTPYSISVTRIRKASDFVPVVDFLGNRSAAVGYTLELPNGHILPTDVTLVVEYTDHDLSSINPFEVNKLALYKLTDGQWMNQAFNGTNPNSTNPSNLVRDPDNNRLMLLATPNTGTFTIGSTISPLPVDLISFSARRQANDALLLWSTATEENNQGYHIEASLDNRTYEPIGFVTAADVATQVNHYTFTEARASRFGLRYYRLVQVDTDGTKTILGVRTVAFDSKGVTVATGPNPFTEAFTATIVSDKVQPATITLTDALGRVVSRQTIQLQQGANASIFSGSRLSAGWYVLSVQLPSEIVTNKLTKH